ncbi:hypothetical protein EW146_g6830 [Bondarzewia mesenterica]|uniref:FAD-binding domain-containing protein n=1 Tax=Bondarzewia mesenterica TaxID=1095465 RepID=A0A4S4LPD5_9AGAM|nr:hypothetical protein EW146_g6830 [Bondarzewia mesenterica]
MTGNNFGAIDRDFRVAIVGGGICGLLCAIGLSKAGIRVDIFESASKYGEVGAGVGIGPNAVRALRALGVLDEIVARSGEGSLSIRPFRFHYGTGDCELVYSYPAGEEDLGLAIHRAALLDGLITHLDSNATLTHFNKRCMSVAPSSSKNAKYTLYFADGSTHETDVVIGADGIRSVVRNFVVGDEKAKKALAYTNTVAYRGLVDTARLRSMGVKTELTPLPVCWMGEGKVCPSVHFTTQTSRNQGHDARSSISLLSQSKKEKRQALLTCANKINVVAFVTDFTKTMGTVSLPTGAPWVTPVPEKELLDNYSGWGRDPLCILSCIERPSKWSIHGLYPQLDTYVRGKVALVGDAAHGMLPHLGAGVGQGIEDVLVLVRLIGHPQTRVSNIEAILQAYNSIREPRATFVTQYSKRAGDIYDGRGPSGPSPEGVRKDVDMMWDKVWHHDLEADVERAVQDLKTKGPLSSQISERCFTYCTQSIAGRTKGVEPRCRTFCIRKVFQHEVNRNTDLSWHPLRQPKNPPTPIEIPLPPESHTAVDAFISGSKDQPSPSSPSPASSTTTSMTEPLIAGPSEQQKHWEEGYYLWMSKSRRATQEHMDMMSLSLPQQADYERQKMQANETWVQATKDGKAVWYWSDQPDSENQGDEVVDGEKEKAPHPPMHTGPPFPDLLNNSSLMVSLSHPPPALHLPTMITKFLAPTSTLLYLVRDSVTSGRQADLAGRMAGRCLESSTVVDVRHTAFIAVCLTHSAKQSEGGYPHDLIICTLIPVPTCMQPEGYIGIFWPPAYRLKWVKRHVGTRSNWCSSSRNRGPHWGLTIAASAARKSAYRVKDHHVAVEGSEILIRCLVPTPADGRGKAFPLLVWYHAGGKSKQPDLAFRIDRICVQRLAPEHPFPTGVNDSYAALKWVGAIYLLSNSYWSHMNLPGRKELPLALRGPLQRIHRIRRGLSLAKFSIPQASSIRMRILIGMTSSLLRTSIHEALTVTPNRYKKELRSYEEFWEAPVLPGKSLLWFHGLAKAPPTDPDFSPLLAKSHVDLPPLCMQLSGMDPFVDEGLLYEKSPEGERYHNQALRISGRSTCLRVCLSDVIYIETIRKGLQGRDPMVVGNVYLSG